eukprot:7636565-Alexandrium_andersonii.AAC.1
MEADTPELPGHSCHDASRRQRAPGFQPSRRLSSARRRQELSKRLPGGRVQRGLALEDAHG